MWWCQRKLKLFYPIVFLLIVACMSPAFAQAPQTKGPSVACGTGKKRHPQRIENKAQKRRRLDRGCFPSASSTAREILSALSSARKARYIKGTYRMG